MAESELILVMTTTNDVELANRIAKTLVEQRLAACVQIIGSIQSVYRWQGAIATGAEWQCLIKTSVALYSAVETTIKSLHPYSLPELIAVPLQGGSDDFLNWWRSELRPEFSQNSSDSRSES